jgi:iron complex outermembrane receptor protein
MKLIHPLKATPTLLALSCACLPIAEAISQDDGVRGLEEIIVTAQKREQNLQDTPVAVTAFGQTDLENKGIGDIADIADFTPNLMFDKTAPLSGASSAAVLFIRGVGQSSFQVTDDPGVGTYVDGVYVGSSVGGVLDVIDVQRIEVLRGPQGTLFGRNTIGGAINVTTKRPADEHQGSFEVTAGNYNRINVRASTDIPLTENLKTKFTAGYKKADGWVDLVANSEAGNGTENHRSQKTPGDDNEGAARLAVLYTPTDELTFYVTADASRVREASAASTLLGVGKNANDPSFDEVDGFFNRAPGREDSEFSANHGILNLVYNTTQAATTDIPGYGTGVFYDDRWIPDNPARESFRTGVNGTDVDTTGFSTTVEWDLNDSISLKSITSFREVEATLNRDADGSPLTIVHCFTDFEHEQYSQELQLSGNSENLKWLAGLYYFKEDATDPYSCELPTGHLLLKATVENTSVAAFAQATYTFLDDFNITFGLRWTEDEKTMSPEFGLVESFDRPETLVPNLVDENGNQITYIEDKYDDVSPSFSIDYQVTEELLLYYSYKEGFKGGGFSSRTLVPRNDVLQFDPEELSTNEIGIKYEGFDRRLRVNAAAFLSEYEGIQGTQIEFIAPGTQNIGDSEIDGFELEVTALPTDNLMVNFTVAYLNHRFTHISEVSPLVSPDGFIQPTDQLTNTPEWSYTASFDYTLPVPSLNGELALRADYSHYSTVWNDDLNSTVLKQSPYGITNAQMAFMSDTGEWSFVIWGKNLTDEEYIVSGDDNIYAGFREANFGEPRTYGATLRRSF